MPTRHLVLSNQLFIYPFILELFGTDSLESLICISILNMEAKELEKKKASTSSPSWDEAGFSLISPINRQNRGQNKGARGIRSQRWRMLEG